MRDFTTLADNHSTAGDAVAALLDEVDAATRAAVAENRDKLDAAIAHYRATKNALLAAVAERQAEFARPRSRLRAGIRYGMEKQRDGVDIAKDTAQRIRDRHADLVPALFTTRLNREAVKKLPARVLRSIHATLKRGGDEPFVKRVRDDLDDRLAAHRL